METTKCRACRSINHASSIRCLNCGVALDPEVVDGSHPEGSPDFPPPPGGMPWVSMVRSADVRPKQTSPTAILFVTGGIILGIIAVVTALVMGDGGGFAVSRLPTGFAVIAIVLAAFWLWMLIDAVASPMDSGTKVMWVLLIVLLGFLGALAYAVMGRGSRR
jgi:hypothetical protein